MSATPGSGEDCIDDGALGILCAHEKNILWKKKRKTPYITDTSPHWEITFHLQEIMCETRFKVLQQSHSRSSSKWVSIPLLPGTEQISRAFRKVVHLFTRLLWPPKSFCWTRYKQKFSRKVQLHTNSKNIISISLQKMTSIFHRFLTYTSISYTILSIVFAFVCKCLVKWENALAI